MSKPKKTTTANLIWFEIPADNPERAKKFYGSLFGWKIKKFPGMTDYWHIDTGGGDDTPDGGLMARKVNNESDQIAKKAGIENLVRVQGRIEQADPAKRSITVMGTTFIVPDKVRAITQDKTPSVN